MIEVLMLQEQSESINIISEYLPATPGHGNSTARPISSRIVLRYGNFARKVEELLLQECGLKAPFQAVGGLAPGISLRT